MTDSIQFYTNPMSRGQIARWALEESGLPYEQVLLEYGTSMKSAEYLAINPMGKVPAIRHAGNVVTEAAAICAYLADVATDAGLAPQADERGNYYRWMFFAAGPVEQAITARSLGWEVASPDQRMMAGFGDYDSTVGALDGWFSRHDFVCGNRFTMADVYVGAQVLWGTEFKTLPELPALLDYAARLNERPAYRRAKAIDDTLIAEAKAGAQAS